jgi:hypothetical protein
MLLLKFRTHSAYGEEELRRADHSQVALVWRGAVQLTAHGPCGFNSPSSHPASMLSAAGLGCETCATLFVLTVSSEAAVVSSVPLSPVQRPSLRSILEPPSPQEHVHIARRLAHHCRSLHYTFHRTHGYGPWSRRLEQARLTSVTEKRPSTEGLVENIDARESAEVEELPKYEQPEESAPLPLKEKLITCFWIAVNTFSTLGLIFLSKRYDTICPTRLRGRI